MYFLPIVIGWMGTGGCQCRYEPPQETNEPDPPPPPTGQTGTTGDTGPEPPCAWPEIEPNDTVLEPTMLGMEQHGCGTIDAAFDSDFWQFTLDDDSWLEIQAEQGNGSIANMTFVLTPVGDDWSATRTDDIESLDATLRFLAPAGDYRLQVTEQTFSGGERFGYEILATEAKEPLTWTVEEVEPNDTLATAMPVLPGDEIYGLTYVDTVVGGDFDWYVLTVPVGKHTVSVDIDAYEFGSSSDLTIRLYDASSEPLRSDINGTGGNPDPVGSYESSGAEYVYIQVSELGNRESPAGWYVLKIGLEAAEE